MSTTSLSLPSDIPWKLLATSKDMLDMTYKNDKSPPKWRSSMAIFTYEPEEIPDELEDRAITYLKVVCSITGYQFDTAHGGYIELGDLSEEQANDLENHLSNYYACYAVLLQVTVFPGTATEREDASKYPIIMDFEPKHRDLYEMVTETGEVLSGSSNQASVSKGFTSTASTETNWGLTGEKSASVGVNVGVAEASTSTTLGGSIGGGTSSGTQDQTLTSVDYSREKRESQSHTTSLTQMYNLLQGYHLGTNRAVFLQLPRPHMVEEVEKRTFINGPREIEGVQEFFLIVERPKDVSRICVEAYLETGHLNMTAGEGTATEDEASFDFDFKAPRDIEHGNTLANDTTTKQTTKTKSYTPPSGWVVDLDKGSGGYQVLWTKGAAAYTVTAAETGVTVSATLVTTYVDVDWSIDKDHYEYQEVQGELLIFLKQEEEGSQSAIKSTFFVTARKVACCTELELKEGLAEWIAYEAEVPVDQRLFSTSVPTSTRMRAANDLSMAVGRQMLRGINSDSRYRPGEVDFHESQYVFERVAAASRRAARRGSGATRPAAGSTRTAEDAALLGGLRESFGADAPEERIARMPVSRLVRTGKVETAESALRAKWRLLGLGHRRRGGRT